MNELFNLVRNFVLALPEYIWIVALGLIAIVVIAVIAINRRARLIRSAARKMELGLKDDTITARLLAHPGLVNALVRKKGELAISHFGIASQLVRKVRIKGKVDDVKQLLRLAPEEGLFPAFRVSLKKELVAQVFNNWLEENGNPTILRQMAFSARGEDFDGKKACRLLSSSLEAIREFSGDPEWPVRYFSLRVLLEDNNPKSIRLVNEAFSDAHPLIRRTVATDMHFGETDDLFGELMNLVLDDPVLEVRQSARSRIEKSFPERWKLDPAGMNALQAVHVLELLKVGSNEDENVAISSLGDGAPESRLAAARFLQKSGTLTRLFTEAGRGDREDWERRRRLLANAVSVGVSGFLDKLKESSSSGVLLLGASLLKNGGPVELITPLAEKAFNRGDPTRDADDEYLYRSAISLACTHGQEKAQALVRDELRKRQRDPDMLGFALPFLPVDKAWVFREVLIDFIKDPDFPADDELVDILARMPPNLFLGVILDILESERSLHSHSVRLKALQCLGAWRLNHTLQIILENLPILPIEKARAFAENLASMDRKALEQRAAFILDSPDAGIRAALIACLPRAGITAFTKEIREGLNDADPDVRIACLTALLDSGELKASSGSLALLRDPVERVRIKAARIAGEKGTDRFLEELETILNATDEAPVVRTAALEGLSASPSKESMNMMVRFLDTSDDLRQEIVQAMAKKNDKKSVALLVEHFKDSEALLRDKIADVFSEMGDSGEDALVGLLKEDISSLKPFLADILTRTGFVEILIRKLGHRKPEVRREAARLLADIATDVAYRGIVLAARDPDKDVRINVTKALETLATTEGESILKSLEADPDRKVRRYTHWALERVRAKKL